MGSFFIVPFCKILNVFKCEAVLIIRLKPLFDFPIALGVFNSAKYLLNAVGIEKLFESRVPVDNVSGKLASVIAYALLDLAMLKGELHTFDAFFSSWASALDERKQFSACIINDCENPKSTPIIVPVDVDCCQAVSSLIAIQSFLRRTFLSNFLARPARTMIACMRLWGMCLP